jgi:hypothetical protein
MGHVFFFFYDRSRASLLLSHTEINEALSLAGTIPTTNRKLNDIIHYTRTMCLEKKNVIFQRNSHDDDEVTLLQRELYILT